jgi:hypothetical protein
MKSKKKKKKSTSMCDDAGIMQYKNKASDHEVVDMTIRKSISVFMVYCSV